MMENKALDLNGISGLTFSDLYVISISSVRETEKEIKML